jgi:quercetin dioxygenase-like cupin family protein
MHYRVAFGGFPRARVSLMTEDRLFQRGTTLVRRLRLTPGEAMQWHRDPFHRVSVVLSGDALAIEYRDGRESERFGVEPGQVGWDEPTDLVHRGVNVGQQPYEEVTIFFLDQPDAVPQPSPDGPG